MKRKRRLFFPAGLVVAFAVGILRCGAANGDEASETPLNVVLFCTGDFFIPAAITQDRAMREAFTAGTKRPVNFYVETLHAYNLSATDFDTEFTGFMRRKYQSQKIDLIMAAGTAALNFLERHHPELWPESPAMFFSVDEASNLHRKFSAGMTGLTIKFEPAGTLDFAMQLHPKSRRVVVVTGASEADRSWIPHIQNHLQSHHPTLRVMYLTNQTVAELTQELRKLPADTVVLCTTFLTDASGKRYVSRAVVDHLGAVSGAPLYGLYETSLDHGIVGGVIPSLEEHGRRAGEMGLRIIAGEKPDAIPVQPSAAAVLMVDWRQLQRWKISESRLPPGSLVRFRPPTLWEQHKRYIVGGLSIIVGQAVTIVALVMQRARRRRAEAAMREEEARMVLAADAANLGAWEWDIARDEIWATGPSRARLGLAGSERIGFDRFLNSLHPDDREPVSHAVANAFNHDGDYESEYRVVVPGQPMQWIAASGRVEFNRVGKPVFVRGVSLDITRRKQAEESLRESEARFRIMANHAPVLIWMSGPDKLCTFFNKGWLDFTGRTLEQELGNGWAEGVHREDLGHCLEVYVSAFDGRREFTMEYRLRRHDAEYRWILDMGLPRIAPDGAFLGYIGTCVDITDRRHAEAAARDLSGRLINAQEDERRRIARELHDDLSQRLALISVELEMFGQKPPAQMGVIAGRMQEFSGELKSMATEVHRLAHDLHPAKLDQLGLAAAVRGFCKELAVAHEIAIESELRDVPRTLPDDVALCLYRITQEALQNAVKHSGATSAKVELAAKDHELRLVVTDDGHGFDPQAVAVNASLGIVSMRERVRMVGGQILVKSRPGEGARIEVRVPISDQVSSDQ